jgi:DNA-binding phage protein
MVETNLADYSSPLMKLPHQPHPMTRPTSPFNQRGSPLEQSRTAQANTYQDSTPKKTIPKINQAPVQNRLLAIMSHTTRYAFKGESRLSADAGVSKSAICRLVNGQSTPSFPLVVALTRALERHLKRALDPREVISVDGTYPTASVCELCGCRGCLPAQAYDEENRLKPGWKNIQPGQWSALIYNNDQEEDKSNSNHTLIQAKEEL